MAPPTPATIHTPASFLPSVALQHHVVETAEVLARPGDRVVLGPALDGGYYLLGVKAEHHRLFQDIAWSTEHVAHQTLERAGELDLPVHVLPKWYDVDDIAGLKMLQAELFEGRSFAPEFCPAEPRSKSRSAAVAFGAKRTCSRLVPVVSGAEADHVRQAVDPSSPKENRNTLVAFHRALGPSA